MRGALVATLVADLTDRVEATFALVATLMADLTDRVGTALALVATLLAVAAHPHPALGALPDAAAAQEEIFAQGNQHYQAGDFAAAIDAYEAVLAAGFASATLHYNLGNAYFKAGELGRAILAWERAAERAPRDPDVMANLELARSLTADAVEPLPRFWLVTVVEWWVGLLSRGSLIAAVGGGWLLLCAGTIATALSRGDRPTRVARGIAVIGAILVAVLGTNLFVREVGVGRSERAVILAESVPVRSAPAENDDLTLFEVHEGTTVRIDDRAESWAEVVLEDGKVGWVPMGVLEPI